jgi:osmotically-inducible protein OsmY
MATGILPIWPVRVVSSGTSRMVLLSKSERAAQMKGTAKLDEVRAALHSEARVRAAEHPIHLAFEDGVLTMEGEVADIAAKKLALERAAAVPGVTHIIDRLHVMPAERQEDGLIRDLVRDALIAEPAFGQISIGIWNKGALERVRQADEARGAIELRVENGVVTLAGDVPGLDYKRLAGVLAWWVPGSRDVVNGLGVTPPEQDNDAAMTEAVRLALEKDPFVNADQIRVSTKDSIVTLWGLVPKESEREMAEYDAWYVFGVDKVVNRIEIRS